MNDAIAKMRRLLPWRFAATEEPSARMFHGIRLRLTLWYGAVLLAALLLFGLALYFGVRQRLLDSIDSDLQSRAQQMAQVWQLAGPTCPHGLGGSGATFLLGCYDAHGNLFEESQIAAAVPGVADPSLAKSAVLSGSAADTVNAGSGLGPLRRYALRVSNPIDGSTLGVIELATPVNGEISALDRLLETLLVLGAIVLLVAVAGGLFLGNRALLPARLAYARQRDFIADASHELRTPLTMLRADAEVLLRGRDRLSAEDKALLEDIVAEASLMTSLANNMLNLARLDADGRHMEQEVVDLAALAADLIRRAHPLAAEKNLSLQLENDQPVLVVGDRLLLEEAALVLLDNAIKYNRPGGEVLIRTWTADHQAQLEVRDTGIGIEAEHLPRLGERFYRVDKARSREAGGVGLGVSIAQRIAARHGGSLHLTSEPGHGTTATLSLPAAAATPLRGAPSPRS